MIRIVCPACHSSLSPAELESASVEGQVCLVCPECSVVLLVEPAASTDCEVLVEGSAHA